MANYPYNPDDEIVEETPCLQLDVERSPEQISEIIKALQKIEGELFPGTLEAGKDAAQ